MTDPFADEDVNGAEEFDFFIDMSDEIASSEARDFAPLPVGKYLVNITDIEIKDIKSEKNKGKKMYSLELTVADGKYDGRKVWTNIMLFGKSYSLVWLMKALGLPVVAGRLAIPRPDQLQGEQVVASLDISKERTVIDDTTGEEKTYKPRNEVRSFFAARTWAGTPAAASAEANKKATSVLP